MKETLIDRDGNVRCPKCGAIAFDNKRTGKAKLGSLGLGVLTLGVGAVALAASPKRLKCRGCGENLKRGSGKPYVTPEERAAQYDRLRESRAPVKAERVAATALSPVELKPPTLAERIDADTARRKAERPSFSEQLAANRAKQEAKREAKKVAKNVAAR